MNTLECLANNQSSHQVWADWLILLLKDIKISKKVFLLKEKDKASLEFLTIKEIIVKYIFKTILFKKYRFIIQKVGLLKMKVNILMVTNTAKNFFIMMMERLELKKNIRKVKKMANKLLISKMERFRKRYKWVNVIENYLFILTCKEINLLRWNMQTMGDITKEIILDTMKMNVLNKKFKYKIVIKYTKLFMTTRETNLPNAEYRVEIYNIVMLVNDIVMER